MRPRPSAQALPDTEHHYSRSKLERAMSFVVQGYQDRSETFLYNSPSQSSPHTTIIVLTIALSVPRYWYWALVVYGRKTALAALALLFGGNVYKKTAAAQVVLIVAFVLQSVHEPFLRPVALSRSLSRSLACHPRSSVDAQLCGTKLAGALAVVLLQRRAALR
jgi:hypothetical protein